MDKKSVVLIVDDNIENINVLSEILEIQGHEVFIAKSGQDALKSISITTPDIILLDINMPGLSGYEVCSELKKNARTVDIPVIFLSALNEVMDMVKAFNVGGIDYITKPYIPEIVLARVKTHIDLSRIKQNLEKIVSERTSELRNVNEELLITTDTLKEHFVELEEAKERIEERENSLRSLANNLVNGMIYQVIADNEGYRKFIFLSETVNKFYGCTVDEAKADPNLIYGRIHKEDLQKMVEEEKEAIRKMGIFKTEARVVNPDGSIRWSSFVSSPSQSKGYTTWDGLEIDITEQKINQQELIKARDKSEESDRLKTAFLQNLSHEIRTPLNAIVGFSGLINNPELSPEKRNNFSNIIQTSSNQLLSIVNDILTISSLETKQEKATLEKVNINNLLLEIHSVYKQQALNRKIPIYLNQDLNDKDSEIYSDGTKIKQILTNLLTNALKFTYEGYVEFGYTLISDTIENENKQFLKFYVKDTGTGIDSNLKEKIFERFRQADLSTNKKYGGAGLGLSISKGFVELLKGKIWVDSETGKGSCFNFTIPYNSSGKSELNIVTMKAKKKKYNVLVAEDEEYNYLYIEEILKEQNINCLHAKNGKQAVELCEQKTDIDLVLMDIKMPVMDGHTAALTIKKFNPVLPIIAQSAYALVHEIEKYQGIFDDYITKPINESELKQKISHFIDLKPV